MAYNNEKKTEDMNTNGFQFYNQKAGSTLVIGHWNDLITIKICPVLAESERVEGKTFDYKGGINVALTAEKAYALAKAIVRGNFEKTVGVPSGTNFIEIGKANQLIPGAENYADDVIAITIYKEVGADGAIKNTLSYIFNTCDVMEGFKGNREEFTVSTVDAELQLFILSLQESVKANTNAVAHSTRNANKFAGKKYQNDLAQIKEKLGIQTESKNNYQSGGTANSFFNNGGQKTGAVVDGGYIKTDGLKAL